MAYWLGAIAHELRANRPYKDTEKPLKAIHVASTADVTESTLSRFENGKNRGFPTDTEKIMDAYAAELEVDPLELWDAAFQAWRLATDGSTVEPTDVKRLVDEAVQRSRKRRGGKRAGSHAPDSEAL